MRKFSEFVNRQVAILVFLTAEISDQNKQIKYYFPIFSFGNSLLLPLSKAGTNDFSDRDNFKDNKQIKTYFMTI